MAGKYTPKKIEPKWQARWEADGLYRSVADEGKRRFYYLTMLPYPSGDLHIGRWYAMTPSDAHARFYRMNGLNVVFLIGFDAFGLPAENAAISHGVHPKERIYANIERMRRQLRSMGVMWDGGREAFLRTPSTMCGRSGYFYSYSKIGWHTVLRRQ
jgi:leucyl-tRNA synthetase